MYMDDTSPEIKLTTLILDAIGAWETMLRDAPTRVMPISLHHYNRVSPNKVRDLSRHIPAYNTITTVNSIHLSEVRPAFPNLFCVTYDSEIHKFRSSLITSHRE